MSCRTCSSSAVGTNKNHHDAQRVDRTVASCNCLAQKMKELNAVANGPSLVRCRLLQPDWRIERVNKIYDLIGRTNVSNQIVAVSSPTPRGTGIAASYVSMYCGYRENLAELHAQ